MQGLRRVRCKSNFCRNNESRPPAHMYAANHSTTFTAQTQHRGPTSRRM